jgi:DNA-directed RNA polymerase specialized sigma24 family protein
MEIKRGWELGQSSFEGLLQKLSPNRDLAAAEYERLRFRLAKFFQFRGCGEPDLFADRTLDRLARRLEAGEQIDPIYSYCCGIGRMLLLEAHRERERQEGALNQWANSQPASSDSQEAIPLDALLKCLQKLPIETQNLVLDYYQGDKQFLIDRRKALADRLGIPINALRLRVNRIRTQLETCVKESQGDMDRLNRPYKGKKG